ncbi:MAG: nucleotide exchange factor GrpE [Planctomycetia bacterium]|nr:nucleotide exchange factor GrpE [Planctomycetia bacterium]
MKHHPKEDEKKEQPTVDMGDFAEELAATEENVAEENPALAEIQRLEQELADERNRALRFRAELENLRKRSARELEEEHRYSGMDVIRDILPVMDNLQRAIEVAEKQDADDPLLAGVRMIFQQFETALERNNCKRIDALHQPFDPNFHQAISQMPSEEFPDNTVLIVAQEGYTLADRVVRPSQVVVVKN